MSKNMGMFNPSMIMGLMKNKQVMNIVKSLNEEQIDSAMSLAKNVNLAHAFNPKKMTEDELKEFQKCASSLGISGLENAKIDE